jgi:hypothetical protein
MISQKKIDVSSLDDLDAVLRILRQRFDTSGRQTVIISNYERNISSEQRGLYWMWLGVISSELGDTKDELHKVFKERFLLNIFLADIDNHQDFAGLTENMRVVKKLAPDQFPAIRSFVMSQLSIMDATTTNMSQYLKEIENEAINMRIRLPLPELQGLL